MSRETVLILSKDEEFIAWIREFLPHLTVLSSEDTKTKFQRYVISVLDSTTVRISESLLERLKTESDFLILLVDDFSDLDEKTVVLASDVWRKPLPKPIVEKRLNTLIQLRVFGMFGINTMAFELKNPLASIKGYADVMLNGMAGDLSEQQRNFIKIMQQNTFRISRRLDDYRDLQNIFLNHFSMDLEYISVSELKEEILSSQKHFENLHSKEIKIQIPDNFPQIYADKRRLTQAIMNLFSIDSEHFVLSAKLNGNELLFCLETDAVLVSQQNPANLGGAWEIIKHIIEAHGGRIWVESKLDKDVTFYFTIPIAKTNAITLTSGL